MKRKKEVCLVSLGQGKITSWWVDTIHSVLLLLYLNMATFSLNSLLMGLAQISVGKPREWGSWHWILNLLLCLFLLFFSLYITYCFLEYLGHSVCSCMQVKHCIIQMRFHIIYNAFTHWTWLVTFKNRTNRISPLR